MPSKLKQLANEIHRRSAWQVLVVYLGASWGVLEATSLFSDRFNLPAWLFNVALGLLSFGFLAILLLAMLPVLLPEDLEPPDAQISDESRRFSTWQTGGIVLLGAMAVWGLIATVWLLASGPSDRETWALAEGLPELQELVEEERWEEAFELAHRLEDVIEDPRLDSLWNQLSTPLSVESDPAGAEVFRRDYAARDTVWEYLGTTPLQIERFPLSPSLLRFSVDGHEDVVMAGDALWEFQDPLSLQFHPSNRDGYCWVPGDLSPLLGGPEFAFRYASPTLSLAQPLRLGDYSLQQHEVTNEEFKRFVEEGGYERREFWEHPFRLGEDELSWEEAMARFTDRTGRPGPSTWQVSNYPEGAEDLPVGGISWYEAAAFARFSGKELPTVYHWYRAATPWRSGWILPKSNMAQDGPVPVGSLGGMSQFGNLDMAGNVREWAFNSSGLERFILGGGWDDVFYVFTVANTASPLDRSEQNGVRLAEYGEDTTTLALARRPIERPSRDFFRETPVPDELYEVFQGLYAYDPISLNSVIEGADTTDQWIRERVVIDATYGGEQLPMYLYLPLDGDAPFQTVVYFPGSGALWSDSFERYFTDHVSMVVNSGRAFLFPVYQSTFERNDGFVYRRQDESNTYRQHVIQWMQDLSRSIDYLETRSDLDSDKVAYFGFSWGGMLAPIALALEPRLRLGILQAGGLSPLPTQPPVDPFNFVSRVTVPVLMLNGEYDGIHPLETAARPMYELLGTPEEHKELAVSTVDHMALHPPTMGRALDWLDRYLGDPRRR